MEIFDSLFRHVSSDIIDEPPNTSKGFVTIKDPAAVIFRAVSMPFTSQISVFFCPGKMQLKQATLLD